MSPPPILFFERNCHMLKKKLPPPPEKLLDSEFAPVRDTHSLSNWISACLR